MRCISRGRLIPFCLGLVESRVFAVLAFVDPPDGFGRRALKGGRESIAETSGWSDQSKE